MQINYFSKKKAKKSEKCHSAFVIVSLAVVLFCLNACESIERVQDSAIARVGDTYLYYSEIVSLLGPNLSSQDSAMQVQNYIDNWAREQLLFQQAELNIDPQKKTALNQMVQQYKAEVYGQVYKESMINTKMDTIITREQLNKTYESNYAIFKLREPVYQYRLLGLPLNNVDRKEISTRFRRFDSLDRHFLDSLSFQFSNYYPWDSLWVSRQDIIESIDFLNEKNTDRYFKNRTYYEVEDSLNVYLFVAKDKRAMNAIAPLSFVEKTIKSLILNRRKIEFLRDFDNDLLQDAIRSNKYEIYSE